MSECIQSLNNKSNAVVNTQARVLACQKQPLDDSQKPQKILLADLTGEIWVLLDSLQYRGPALHVNDVLSISVMRGTQTGSELKLLRAAHLDPTKAGPRLIPARIASRPQDLALLTLLVGAVKRPSLQSLLRGIYSDPRVYNPFVRVPASRAHHHAKPGGLMRHSLEVALTALQLSNGSLERDLTVTAGLLHDIGKIKTFTSSGERSRLGHVVDHEDLTFEVLSPWLVTLNKNWHEGYNALHQMLGTERPYTNYPDSSLRQLLKLADRRSVQENLQSQAFIDKPDWRNHARNSSNKSVWRVAR